MPLQNPPTAPKAPYIVGAGGLAALVAAGIIAGETNDTRPFAEWTKWSQEHECQLLVQQTNAEQPTIDTLDVVRQPETGKVGFLCDDHKLYWRPPEEGLQFTPGIP